jgi:hypothetical protein
LLENIAGLEYIKVLAYRGISPASSSCGWTTVRPCLGKRRSSISSFIFRAVCRQDPRPRTPGKKEEGGKKVGWRGYVHVRRGAKFTPKRLPNLPNLHGPDAGTVILNGRVGGHRALKVSARRERGKGRVSAAGDWLDELSSETTVP